jgi:TonB family protein
MRTMFRSFAIAGVAFVTAAVPAVAQSGLSGAQALYASAQYEDALSTLNQLRSSGMTSTDVPAIEQYRALCLLALGRAAEAEEAIAAAVAANPTYAPSLSDISPRMRSAFTDVRRRVLPTVLQEKYLASKASFDRKEYRVAGEGFTQLLTVLSDASMAEITDRPPLSDLKILAKGFQDLSATALATAPPPAPEVRADAPPAPREEAKAAVVTPRIYTLSDAAVTQPAILNQALPPYPRRPLRPMQGVVEVVINERGAVENAAMRQSVDPIYDQLALAASRTWSYRPAMREGTPVKFRKLVQVRIQP